MVPFWTVARDLRQAAEPVSPYKVASETKIQHFPKLLVVYQECTEGQKYHPMIEGYETLEPCSYLTNVFLMAERETDNAYGTCWS